MSPPRDFASRWHRVGALRLHSLVSTGGDPSGPTMVLMPGLVTASRSMVPLGRVLAGSGRWVWILDPPGFGYSDKPTRALSMSEQASIAAEWLDAAGLAPARLLGNSFGSQVAAAAAAHHPQSVARLVLLSPTAGPVVRKWLSSVQHLPDPVGSRDRAAGRLRAGLLGKAHDVLGEDPSLRLLNVAEYALASLPRAVSTVRCAVLEEMEGVLPRVEVPTLVVRAERDYLSSSEWAWRLTESLPDGRLASLPGAGHAAFYARPQLVAEVAEPFLAADHPASRENPTE